MRIIEIEANNLGGHRNQWTEQKIEVPEGWAIIPDSLFIPHTFPFVELTVEDGIVTEMTEGTMPEPTPTPSEPTADDVLNALLGVE